MSSIEQDIYGTFLTTHLEPETCSKCNTFPAAACSAHYKRKGCTRAEAAQCVRSGLDSESSSSRTSHINPWSCPAMDLEGERKEVNEGQ